MPDRTGSEAGAGPRWGRAPPGSHRQQRIATVSRPRRSAAVSERSPWSSYDPDCLSHGGSHPACRAASQRANEAERRWPAKARPDLSTFRTATLTVDGGPLSVLLGDQALQPLRQLALPILSDVQPGLGQVAFMLQRLGGGAVGVHCTWN
jgi:hypothetical protein